MPTSSTGDTPSRDRSGAATSGPASDAVIGGRVVTRHGSARAPSIVTAASVASKPPTRAGRARSTRCARIVTTTSAAMPIAGATYAYACTSGVRRATHHSTIAAATK
jgi:hypothetical protein